MRTVRIGRSLFEGPEMTFDPDGNPILWEYEARIPGRAVILSVELRKGGGVIVTWTLEP
jgi:hypothetical protein